MKAIILAAGIGSRMGSQLPKSFMKLPSGKRIIDHQIEALQVKGIKEIVVVVGFKKEIVMEECPIPLFKYNPVFHITNTSKSLLYALDSMSCDDVIWINGDVAFEEDVLGVILSASGNVVGVNTEKCGAEEVKYRTHDKEIIEISKTVSTAEGEAIGINKITAQDFEVFVECLKACKDNDYFERGIEFAIEKGVKFYPADISHLRCIEMDFIEDYHRMKEVF